RETAVEDGNLTQAIFVLRKLIGDPDQQIIVTLPGRGYMFTAPVETIQPAKQESSTTTAGSRTPHRRAGRFPGVPLIPAVGLGLILLAVATILVSMRLSRIRSSALPFTTRTMRFRVPVPETLHLSRSG